MDILGFCFSFENLEQEIVDNFSMKHPHEMNGHIHTLLAALNIDKKEDESSRVFEDRLFGETKKILFT